MRTSFSRARRFTVGIATAALAASALAACGSGSASGSSDELRLGYFPNLTHATALVGVKQGFLQQALGATKLTTQTFNAGTTAVEALNAGAIDATYIGPNPAINAYLASGGEAIRIISGATSGGAALVVQPGITGAADLKGKIAASPQLGNTQDVALRYWLDQNGLKTKVTGTGDVDIQSTDNAIILQQFQDKKIDAAWMPEPWVSRMVTEAGGTVLVDEASLWPRGRFVTTQLIVRTQYLEDYPAQVKALLQGHVATTRWINKNPARTKAIVNDELLDLTGKALAPAALNRAWDEITVTNDPIAGSLIASAQHALAVGVTRTADIRGIYDLTLLNEVLDAEDEPPVDDEGYGPSGRQ